MNKYIIVAIIPFFMLSCNDDLKKLKQERSNLTKEVVKLNGEIEVINERIAKMEKQDIRETIIPYTVAAQPFQRGISIQSNVSTEQDVVLYPEYAGSISWSVREGQKVGKGQVIANSNDGGMTSQLKQAQIQADLAKTAYERQSRLWTQDKIGSEIQYLQSKSAYEASQKSISAIQSQLSRTKVKAPFSGTIDNLIMQSGQG